MGCMEEYSSGKACPTCGYEQHSDHNPNYLRPETALLSRYIIGRLLRKNGESGLYMAFDNSTKKKIWVREYFPHKLAARKGNEILPTEGCGAGYKTLMRDFLEVCSTVKRLAAEQVVPLEAIFEANNTVYAVYRYSELITLESYLAQRGGKLAADKALDLLMPIFGAVQSLHNLGEIHRGISPYTIFVSSSGKALLGDFMLSAARTGGSELEAELYNGFTSPEQYAINGWQGEWSDVYALAAVFYRVISGTVPPRATLLGQKRGLTPLIELVPAAPLQISDAITSAMQLKHDHRTQTVAGLVAGMTNSQDIGKTAVFNANDISSAADDYDYDYEERQVKSGTFKFLAIAMVLTVLVLIGFMYFIATTLGIIPAGPAEADSSSSRSSISVSSSSQVSSISSVPSSEEPSSQAPIPTVPRFVGAELEAVIANEEYKERFIFDIREEFNASNKEGVIYDQAPVEGTLMPNRGTIIIYVSKGPAKIEMPNLIGMDLDKAMQTLYEMEKELNLKLPMQVYEAYSPTGEPGEIFRTFPVAGADFFPDKQIIEVSVVLEPEVSESVERPSSSSGVNRPQPSSNRSDDD